MPATSPIISTFVPAKKFANIPISVRKTIIATLEPALIFKLKLVSRTMITNSAARKSTNENQKSNTIAFPINATTSISHHILSTCELPILAHIISHFPHFFKPPQPLRVKVSVKPAKRSPRAKLAEPSPAKRIPRVPNKSP